MACRRPWLSVCVFLCVIARADWGAGWVAAAEPAPQLPRGIGLEVLPTDPQATKIVLIAGSTFFKPGEHEYIGGCAVLFDLLKQTPGVFPVLAVDWPTKPETLAGAKAVVFLFDGGDKHALLKENRLEQVRRLADAGVGLVHLHQLIDYPKDLGDRGRELAGGVFEKGYSQRGHWITEFKNFSDHPVFRGVKPFRIDDGWLYKSRFVSEMKGITPLLRTVSPKAASQELDQDSIVSWLYEREKKGRSFVFTGAHLYVSFAEEGYRRFLVNGILWTAQLDIPSSGAPVQLNAADLDKYLEGRPKATVSTTPAKGK